MGDFQEVKSGGEVEISVVRYGKGLAWHKGGGGVPLATPRGADSEGRRLKRREVCMSGRGEGRDQWEGEAGAGASAVPSGFRLRVEGGPTQPLLKRIHGILTDPWERGLVGGNGRLL